MKILFFINLFLIILYFVNSGNIETSVNRWETIPYEISPDLEFRRNDILTAIQQIHDSTIMRLRPKENTDPDWVIFTEGSGCSSFVGRRGGPQNINLAAGCSIGSIMHEILHAMGGHHEHTRRDRDSFVTIFFDRIVRGTQGNFIISSTSNTVGNYDYDSIMHYPRRAFSNNGQDTIVPINPNVAIGQRTSLSPGDIQTFNYLTITPDHGEEEEKIEKEEEKEEIHKETLIEIPFIKTKMALDIFILYVLTLLFLIILIYICVNKKHKQLTLPDRVSSPNELDPKKY